MKTEDAKTKWCPMVRILIGPENAKWQNALFTNREDNSSNCMADGCAVWVRENSETGFKYGHCGLVRP